MTAKVDMLETIDIFDIYGCEFVFNHQSADKDDVNFVSLRIDEIYQKYVTAARERIKAECRFLGISEDEFEGMNFKQLLNKLNDLVEKEFENQAESLIKGGTFNGLQAIVNANRMSGQDMSGIDLKKFGIEDNEPAKKKNSINTESLIKDEKWHIIAEAFQNLEDAETTAEKISSVDYLNDLQHNSFHLLIDLQTGRMLEGSANNQKDHGEAVNIVQEVLDIKHDAKSPIEFAGKMSNDISKLVRHYEKI